MSMQFSNTFNEPAPTKDNVLRGFLIGLTPLVLLIVIVAGTFLLTALARQLVVSSGFFAQQQVAVITLAVGLVVSLAVFIVAAVFTFRRVKTWQSGGASGQARAALLALGFTALVVLLPVILAIVLPQHPAP